MSIRRIRVFPDPILRKKCRVVRRVDDKVKELAADMIETMDSAGGVGLAANQVGALQRVITLHLPGDEDAFVLLNPEIQETEGEREIIEGCLSFPGYEGMVTRSITVKARWLDENGSKMKITTEDLFAQALEHEVDHLNGILYVDHLLAHEKLASAGSHIEEGEPHMHDVEVEVHADHSDQGAEPEEADIEVVHSTIKFSDLYSESSVDQMHYDLRQAGYVIDASKSAARKHDHVESDDPHLDGGVILDRDHSH
ncbi:MAG: peptide deformylase [Chloroflexi bacterium]|nr:peptide deformylase [Chloroflexota bacterium]MBT3863419.1 peptide deformylase [Chloroflexota bacterium]MBT4341303.1 peptide deformylase [Chloroflexota bacterium]MBT4943171.1 peptide deformylase [Chloroflexota bacterium]MBT5253036.1 peptide deformylase [Chloroflexota bacterium]